MDGLPNPWAEFDARATQIERAVDSLGDTAYRLVFDYVSGDDHLRLLNEGNAALEQTCAGLHWLGRIAEEARELSKPRTIHKIATGAGNAPVTDMEGTRENHPSQPAPVALPPEDTA